MSCRVTAGSTVRRAVLPGFLRCSCWSGGFVGQGDDGLGDPGGGVREAGVPEGAGTFRLAGAVPVPVDDHAAFCECAGQGGVAGLPAADRGDDGAAGRGVGDLAGLDGLPGAAPLPGGGRGEGSAGSRPARHGHFAPDDNRNCHGGKSALASLPAASLPRSAPPGLPCSAPRESAPPDHDLSVSLPLGPAPGNNSPMTSCSTKGRDYPSPARRTRRYSRHLRPVRPCWPGPSPTPRISGAYRSQTTSPSAWVSPAAPPR